MVTSADTGPEMEQMLKEHPEITHPHPFMTSDCKCKKGKEDD